jgi:hypothetical protein
MEWWQLIKFENPDNEVRVVRNLYIIVTVSRITFRLNRYPQEALQNGGIGVDTTLVVTNLGTI